MRTNHILIISTALSILLAACGDGVSTLPTAAENDVTGTVREWNVQVAPTSVGAGGTTFSITNEGSIGHEFLVIKTDFADGQIPLTGDHFDEESPGIEVIDEIGEFPAGKTSALSVSLEEGSYQLVCNLPGHYKAGMHMSFTVTN